MILTSYNVPGTYLSEGTYGAIPQGLSTHSTIYMLVTSNKVDAPTVPTYINSPDDFYNVYGNSPSAASVRLFFNQRSGSGIWVILVKAIPECTITIPVATANTAYTLTLDGYVVSYVSTNTDTPGTILESLSSLVNSRANHLASLLNGKLRTNVQETFWSSNITLTPDSVNIYPVVNDVSDALSKLPEELTQGYLLAPEFFQSYTNPSDRTALQLTLESFCSQPTYNWVALIDCGQSTATQTTAAGAVNLAKRERESFSSPKGHSWYYFPYLVDLADNLVPASGAVAGLILRKQRAEGFQQPSAGVNYPIYGVKDVSYQVDKPTQGQLNPLGINCIRRVVNKGILLWGARTLSTSPFYLFGNVRTILNVLAGTLSKAFDELIFSSVNGSGVTFGLIKGTASDICERLRVAGALYGTTPQEAYLVTCDTSNNLGADLDNGIVNVDVVVKPAPGIEVVAVRMSRSSLGAVLAEVVSSGTSAPIAASPTSTK